MLNTPEEFNYSFPEPATPLPGAVLNDWRFYEYTMKLNERTDSKPPQIIEPAYSTWTVNPNAKIKGKNRHNLNLFVLSIPTPTFETIAKAAEVIQC
jgi:hypothetical protein